MVAAVCAPFAAPVLLCFCREGCVGGVGVVGADDARGVDLGAVGLVGNMYLFYLGSG